MYYAQRRSPGSNAIGIGLVVVLHLGVGYALLTALATQNVNKAPPPLQATVIADKPKIIEPPPPPPPGTPEHQKLDYRPPIDLTIATPPSLPSHVQIVTTTPPPSRDLGPSKPAEPPVAETYAPPTRVAGPPLHYPSRPQSMGLEGSVDVQCDVNEFGGTSNCSMIEHEGALAFVDEALDYVRATRYSPATRNGTPVAEKNHRFHITFKLTDK